MDLAVTELLEQEERKAIERKRLKEQEERRKRRDDENDFIKLSPNSNRRNDFESKYRASSPLPKGDLFGGRNGAGMINRLKYEDDQDTSNARSSPQTPRDNSEHRGHSSRDSRRGTSDKDSANGSVRSGRLRSRSPSTGRHSRRERDHYHSRHDDRRKDGGRYSRDYDRGHRSRYEGGEHSSRKRQASDDVDMTDAPPSSRARHDRSPHGDRPGSSYKDDHSDRRYRDDRRYDDRYHGSRNDDYRRRPGEGLGHVEQRRQERREPMRKKTPEPTDDERDLRTVFCQQLAARLRTRELKEFFEQIGTVVEAQIVKDRTSTRSKGVGYVEFKDKDSVEKALGLTGHKLLGIPIIVRLSESEKNRQAKATEGMTSANNNGQPYHRLYVGNIQFSITEEDLTTLFEAFGPLDFVQLQRDEHGRSKGYGFVQYTDPKDAQAALESMNGQMLNNRPMRVGLGTTDKLAQEANISLQQRQAQTGSAFSGAGGRGGYVSKEEINKNSGASALEDADVTGVSLSNVNRHDLMRKLARMDDPNDKSADTKLKTSKPTFEKVDPTRCICLSNMWSAKTTQEKNWQKEVEEDVRQECNEGYGIVKHVGVDANSQNGEIYVKFADVSGAIAAYKGLNGRFFDGARISCKYVVDAVYNIIHPKAANL